jgi:hypothetical protein
LSSIGPVSVSDLLERLLPRDAPIDKPRRRPPGKNFEARERPALRHEAAPGIEVRIYKVEGNRDDARIILFSDAEHRFVSLADVKSTDWDALAQRGTLKRNVARQARRLRSYLRGKARFVGEDERASVRLLRVDRRYPSMVFRRSPSPSVRREVEETFGDYGVSVVWLDRPPPNADQFPTWEQILNGC